MTDAAKPQPMTEKRLAKIREINEALAKCGRRMWGPGLSPFGDPTDVAADVIDDLLAEVDRLRTRPPGVARVRLTASWLEPKVGSLFRLGETEADGHAVDWVWLDDDFARGRGVNEISRECYEIIEEG